MKLNAYYPSKNGPVDIIIEEVRTGMYKMKCPVCGEIFFIDIKEHDVKTIDVNQDPSKLLADITPSIVCPYNCGFHVIIHNGIAKDAKFDVKE